jgi:hypothetical protein
MIPVLKTGHYSINFQNCIISTMFDSRIIHKFCISFMLNVRHFYNKTTLKFIAENLYMNTKKNISNAVNYLRTTNLHNDNTN